jgi:hypothetical protein
MIYPRLNRVRNGQRLSVELVNGLIKRTEYAADLLEKYRILDGIKTYKGTTISLSGAAYNDGSDPDNPLTQAEVLDRFTEENNEAGNIVFPDPFVIYLDLLGIAGYWLANAFIYTRGGPDPAGQTLTLGSSFFPDQGVPPNASYWYSLGYRTYAFTSAPMTQIGAGPPYTLNLPTKLLFLPV